MTKRTQVNAEQIRDKAVSREKLDGATVGTDELIDGSVTGDKIANGAVGADKLTTELLGRVLPETTGSDRNYNAALQAAAQPSEQNPFATMNDVKGDQRFWGAPTTTVPTFRGDPVGTAKLDRVSGQIHFKNGENTSRPIVVDHSVAANLEANPEHRHVNAKEKDFLAAIINTGVTPSQATSLLKGADGQQVIVRYQDYENVENGASVTFLHPDLNDPNFKRFVQVSRNYDLSGFFTDFLDLGHGVWFRKRDYGSGISKFSDHQYFPDSANTFTLPAEDTEFDGSVVGMRVRGTQAFIQSVERNENGEIVVTTSPDVQDRSKPMILTPIEVGDGKGFVGHRSLTSFERKYLVGFNGGSPVIVSDGEGSYYVLYLTSNGQLRASRFHSSGEYVATVNLLPSSSGDQWPTTSFQSIKAGMILRKAELTSILDERILVVSAVDTDGNGWILTSSNIPKSIGSEGRSSSAISISFSEARLSSDAWEDHLPRQHEVYVINQGTADATALIVTCDDTVVVWTSVNDTDPTLSASGVLSYSFFGSTFRGVSAGKSVELIVRTAQGIGQWRRAALNIPTGKWGSAVESNRVSNYEYISDVPDNNIDIARAQVRISGDLYDAIVIAWSTKEGLNVLIEQLDAAGSSITTSAHKVRQNIHLQDIMLLGAKDVHLFSRSDKKVAGLSYRRIMISDTLEDYIEVPKFIGDQHVVSKTVSSHRVLYNDENQAILVTDTLQTEPLLGYDGFQFNEHDLALIVRSEAGLEILEAKRPVRLRSIVEQNPATPLVATLANQFKTVQSFRPWNTITDFDNNAVSSAEGAAANSIYDPSGNEWLIVTGGVEGPERQIDALGRVLLIRNRMTGTPEHPAYLATTLEPTIVKRAYHGQCVVANATSSAVPSVPGSSCFVFCFGGRRSGGIDEDIVGAFAENVVTRFLLQNLDDSTNDLSEVETSSVATVDLTASIPTLLKPVLFTCWDGTLWRLVIVRAPRIWILKESVGTSLFGATMPGVANAYEVGPSPSISVPDRSVCAYFQENSASPGDYIWNPDLQLSRPGKTTVLCFGANSTDGKVLVLDFDPANEADIRWQEVVIDSNQVPAARIDATLVWSGVKKGSADTPDRQLFMLYGGIVGNKPSSEVWMLEYWRDELNTPRAKWIFLSDAAHYGIAPAVSSAFGARRPTSTSKTGFSDHAVYFGGGRLASGYEEPGLLMLQLPYQMKAIADIPLEGMAMDMGGDLLPVNAHAVSEPIILDNVQSLSGPIIIEALDGANNEINNQVRVAVGMEGTDDLYSLTYNGSSWEWTTAFNIDSMSEYACTLADFNTGMTEAQLVRGSTSFFTAASKKLYLVFMIPAMDPNDVMRLSSVRFLTQPQEHDANAYSKPTWMNVIGNMRVALASPKSVHVTNNTGSTIEKLRVAVIGVDEDPDD